ncbi:MAG TPA: cytochrome c biogenesis protein ResB [Syntrophomonas sp.]|jgi:cytochrome c biogenesis protein|nr:cytochrome c biogenesis protein ResB [Syntrophomonas sp.]
MKKWTKKLWLLFTAMKTGLILLGLTALLSGIGTFVSEDVYALVWLKLLFGLLCINLIVCSISRFNSAVKRSFHPQIPRNIHAVPQRINYSVTGNSSELRQQLENVLNTRGYRLDMAETTDGWAFTALKHRMGYWGSYIVHIAFVLIVIGVMMGAWGFSGGFMGLSGDTVKFNDINFNKGSADKGYSVRINAIEDRYLANGERDNWYTNISIIQSGRELATGTLSVNHPFKYDGVYYYQSKYADYAFISVELDGRKISSMIPLGLTADASTAKTDFHYRLPQKIQNSLYVKGLKLQNRPVVYLQVYGTGDKDALLQLTPGQSEFVFNQYKITLENLTNATGLQVKYDPGVPVVWLGCGMLLLGLILSFYWRPLLVSGVFLEKGQTGTLSMGMSMGKMAKPNEIEFSNILEALLSS